MANQIIRNVYVLQDSYKEPIDYTRATNALPLVFNFQDYTIPEGSTAQVFCAKPSGNAVYTPATISGNSVTVDVTTQMFIELGITNVQISIVNGSDTLVTFAWPVNVQPNYTEGDIPPSQNQSGFWEELQQQVDEAVENCNTAAANVEQVIQESQQATQDANNATANANNAAQQVFDKQYILTANQTFGLSDTVQPTSQGNALIEQIGGDTWQQKTNGYQLFDASKLPSKTQGGATVTNNGDGSFTVSGSGNLTGTFLLSYIYTEEEALKLLSKIGVYKLGSDFDLSVCPIFIWGLYGNDGSLVIGKRIYTGVSASTTQIEIVNDDLEKIASGEYQLRTYFYGSAGNAIKAVTVKPMIYIDGTGEWEPFTGGKPSPSPEYPQHIYGIGDTGYFDGELQSGAYVVSNGAYINNQLNIQVCNVNPIPVSANDTIVLKYETVTRNLIALFYQADGTYISNSMASNVDTLECQAPANSAYMNVVIKSSDSSNITQTITPQTAGHIAVIINGKYAVKVDCVGKNICPPINEWDYQKSSNRYVIQILLKAGKKYYASSDVPNPSGGKFVFYFLNTDTGVSKSLPKSYTPQSDEYVYLYAYMGRTNSDGVLNGEYYIQVEEADSPTDYIPYQHSLSYLPISYPLYKGDQIAKIGSEYKVRRENGVAVFDGSEDENWLLSETGDENTMRFRIVSAQYTYDTSDVLCSRFNNRIGNHTDTEYIIETAGTLYINIFKNRLGTQNVSGFKTWLQSNPITVVYKLSAPVYEDIDQDQFYSIMAADELTNVSLLGENDNLSPTNVIRFPRNEDGALVTTAYAIGMTNQLTEESTSPGSIIERISALEASMAQLEAQNIVVQ